MLKLSTQREAFCQHVAPGLHEVMKINAHVFSLVGKLPVNKVSVKVKPCLLRNAVA